ncbi:MAG TPA: substrate-binding domain-containing protein, partial [Anaerolineaceae bacterium]
GRTNVLGLVIPAGVAAIFSDPYFPILIQGVSTACNALGYTVMLWLAEPEYERRMIHQILHNGLLDGVIIASALMEDSIVQSLYTSKMPFIMVGRHPSMDVNYLDVDNVAGAHNATAHLLRIGRKRVATITGPMNMIAGHDRYQGYADAFHQRNVTLSPDLVVEGDFTEMSGYTCMRELLGRGVDAVFVASDAMAYGAMRAVRESDLRIPEDVAMVGYDDLPGSARTSPALTTIRQPVHRMGAVVTETLVDIIHHPTPQPRHVILPTELVIRDSSGAYGSKNVKGKHS